MSSMWSCSELSAPEQPLTIDHAAHGTTRDGVPWAAGIGGAAICGGRAHFHPRSKVGAIPKPARTRRRALRRPFRGRGRAGSDPRQ
jgi:hypothetical protein